MSSPGSISPAIAATLFADEVDALAHDIISNDTSFGREFTTHSIIRYLPMVMDVAERNICKKCLKKIHKKRPSDELCYLIKHKQELGDQKARFVARVAERMAEIADIDFGTIRPLIPTIIQTIQDAAIHKRSSPFTCFSGAN